MCQVDLGGLFLQCFFLLLLYVYKFIHTHIYCIYLSIYVSVHMVGECVNVFSVHMAVRPFICRVSMWFEQVLENAFYFRCEKIQKIKWKTSRFFFCFFSLAFNVFYKQLSWILWNLTRVYYLMETLNLAAKQIQTHMQLNFQHSSKVWGMKYMKCTVWTVDTRSVNMCLQNP